MFFENLIFIIGGVIIANNSQCRKWQITINNPDEHNITDEIIKELLMKFSPDYYCMSKEIGNKTKNYHIHIFLYSKSPIRFNTIKNRFPVSHIEKAYGSITENIEYIRKTGKWENTDKTETSIEGSFEEYGIVPTELLEKDPIMGQLLEDIKNNKSNIDIIEENPRLAFRIKEIDVIRQTYLADRYSKENRDIVVTYIYGATGTGKTRGIFEKHGARNICRITNYNSSRGILFDNYNNSQEVLVFEEFHSQIPIEDMLNYLDVYPIMLPARYNDKVACYTKVYITSNIPLENQYENIKGSLNKCSVYQAFLRRIHNVIEYKENGEIIVRKNMKEVINEKNN